MVESQIKPMQEIQGQFNYFVSYKVGLKALLLDTHATELHITVYLL
jgi:hypothetical protein